MRSVYAKVLWLSLAILTFSLGVFLYISRLIAVENFGATAPVGKNATVQYEDASRKFNKEGIPALSAYLNLLHSAYPNCQFVFVRKGRDVITGTDYSRKLRAATSLWSPLDLTGPILIAIPSPRSEDALIIDTQPRSAALYLPYYLVLLCSVGILAWALAFQFARPLMQLIETLQRFGRGELSARVRSQRRDEIGAFAAGVRSNGGPDRDATRRRAAIASRYFPRTTFSVGEIELRRPAGMHFTRWERGQASNEGGRPAY